MDSNRWKVEGTATIPADAQEAFDAVTKKVVGAKYEAVMYAGSQMGIQGKNHMFIAKQIMGSKQPITRLMKMFIHKDDNGEAVLMALLPFEVFRSFQIK